MTETQTKGAVAEVSREVVTVGDPTGTRIEVPAAATAHSV